MIKSALFFFYELLYIFTLHYANGIIVNIFENLILMCVVQLVHK